MGQAGQLEIKESMEGRVQSEDKDGNFFKGKKDRVIEQD
jgi:hypothetical protein